MFKKDRDIAERSKTLLKNKDIRTLKADVLKKFTYISEEELSSVIPNKADVAVTKLANKTLLYSIDGATLVIDVNGRNNLLPALPFLWRCPHALPCMVIHSPVSEFVLRGADLMIPGICKSKIAELAAYGLKEGDMVSIRVLGNPLPFAVGEALVSGAALAGGKTKGRAVTVLHVYGDLIATGGSVPNSGFGQTRIYPVEGFVEPGGGGGEGEDEGDYESDNGSGSGNEKDDGENAAVSNAVEEGAASAGGDPAFVEPDEGDGVEQELGEHLDHLCITDHSTDPIEQTAPADPAHSTDTADVAEAATAAAQDALLLQAVLLASKYVIKDKQLPMLVSAYWALLQRCAAAAGLGHLEVKHSTYRKVTPFLAHCAALDLLSCREDSGVATVTRLNRTHDLFRGVKVDNPEAFKAAVLNSSGGSALGAGDNNSGGGSGSSGGKGNASKVQVLELYKLTKHLRDVFGTPRGEYGEFLRAFEVRDMMSMYIRSHNLESESDKGSLLIPPSDPAHKLLASYSSANTTKDAHSVGKGKGLTGSSVDHDAVPAGDEMEGPDAVEYGVEDGEVEDEYPPLSGDSSSGVGSLLAAVGGVGSAADIQMKIHSGGLRSVDDAVPGAGGVHMGASGSSGGNGIAGGSAVGGWGVDKGTVWKPVSLSTARAAAAASSATIQPGGKHSDSSSKTSRDREFPTLSSSTKASITSKASAAAAGGVAAQVYSELPTDLHMRKEEVYKAVLKKMSPYFGIIAHNGSLAVHSGQVPKAKVLVEGRQGNKAVTILRGLEVFGIDLSGLVKDCQKRFACSVALSSVPGFAKEKEIVIQGNLAYETESYLVEQLGIPRTLIELDCSKGAKLKKRK